MAFLGDIANNVTYDLMRAACVMGFHINVPSAGGIGVDGGRFVALRDTATIPRKP